MKVILLISAFTLFLVSALTAGNVRYVTLEAEVPDTGTAIVSDFSEFVDVAEGELVEVVFSNLPYNFSNRIYRSTIHLQMPVGSLSSKTYTYNQQEINNDGFPIIAGPCRVAVNARNAQNPDSLVTRAIATIKITRLNDDNFISGNTVVIPAEPRGAVEIILESSVDQVTWTRAEPGTYGSSTERRFFRLRAVRQD